LAARSIIASNVPFEEDGRWEMGDGRWEMGDGRWEMGDGMGAATVSWTIQPGGRVSYIQSSISDAFVEGTKKERFVYLNIPRVLD
jgi:hypothetical protein